MQEFYLVSQFGHYFKWFKNFLYIESLLYQVFFACLKACLKWSLIQYKLDYVPDYFNKIPGRISKPWWIKFCVILPAT